MVFGSVHGLWFLSMVFGSVHGLWVLSMVFGSVHDGLTVFVNLLLGGHSTVREMVNNNGRCFYRYILGSYREC
jgi:hypothetical protein